MAFWDRVKNAFVDARRKDEEYHARALHEIQSGYRRDGLWAKAVMSSGGDKVAAQLAYFKLLVQAIRDEDYLAGRSAKVSAGAEQQSAPRLPPSHSQIVRKPGLLKSLWFWFLVVVSTLVLVFSFPGIMLIMRDGHATVSQLLPGVFFWFAVLRYSLKKLFPGTILARWLDIVLLLLGIVLLVVAVINILLLLGFL